MNASALPTTWILHDGHAGNRRQALALASALDVPFREFAIALAVPWRWFAPRMRWPWPQALPRVLRDALNAPPALVIGCGRAAAFATAMLRTHVPGCRAIQILDPRVEPRHFDWVIAPAHDGLAGRNVITTLGALNPIDAAWLDEAAHAHAALTEWPSPRLALLIGGPHRDWAFDLAALERLLQAAADWQARCGGSVWLSTSRRSPGTFDALLATFARAAPHRMAYLDTKATVCEGAVLAPAASNPYPGFLALADTLLVTADSVNLASEACATGKPVYVFEPERAQGKLQRFHAALAARGHARDSARIADRGSSDDWPPALREVAVVAERMSAWLGDERPL